MCELEQLVTELVAEGERKNRLAANEMYLALLDIARTGNRAAARALARRNYPR